LKSIVINILLLLYTNLWANAINISLNDDKIDVLSKSEILVTDRIASINEVKDKGAFTNFLEKHINLGLSHEEALWIKFKLVNRSEKEIDYLLELDNPILEHITLYNYKNSTEAIHQGILHRYKGQKSILPYFDIHLEANKSQEYLMRIQSRTTTTQLSLQLIKKETYLNNDKNKQFNILLFIGVISGFFIYGLSIFVYTKNISYFYYALYLLSLSYQQLTYVGFLPIYSSESFITFDNGMSTIKGGISIILSALFSSNFLKVSNVKHLARTYKVFIVLTLILLSFSTPWFYHPEFMMITALAFIFFNEYAAIYMYRSGNKQARFFIVGWTFVMIGYTIFLLDIFGLFSVMYATPTLVLWATAVEALMLLLAFVDNVSILQQQRTELSNKLNMELQQRHDLIERQVKLRTQELQLSLKEKQTLYKELHHRVKNNLQIIISLLRLQQSEISDSNLHDSFAKLEGRIKAMAKTHEFLYQSDKIDKISMYDYLLTLCDDIEDTLGEDNLSYKLDIEVFLPFREALYVGLIVNEFIYNAFKYRYDHIKVEVVIEFCEVQNIFRLIMRDNGAGFHSENENRSSSLGLKLIRTLVENQLHGELNINSKINTEFIIEFRL